jgi:hypothetical protein
LMMTMLGGGAGAPRADLLGRSALVAAHPIKLRRVI